MSTWTPERIALLTELAAKGKTARQIASQMGDVTRNAVIGRIIRSGIPWPNSANKSGARRVTHRNANSPRAAKIKATPRKLATDPSFQPMPLPLEQPPAPIAQRKTVATLTDKCCRWPIGHPGTADFHFCGAQKHVGAYCEVHTLRAFEPFRPRAVFSFRGNRMTGPMALANAKEFTDA